MSHQSPFMRRCIAGHQPFSLQRTGCPNSKCKNLLPRQSDIRVPTQESTSAMNNKTRHSLWNNWFTLFIIDWVFFLIYYFFPFSWYHLALLCQIQTLVVDFIFITHYWAMMWQMKSFMIFFNQTFLLSELQWE